MATHRLGAPETAGFFSLDMAAVQRRRAVGHSIASVLALAAYVGLLVWVLRSSTGKVYGFPVSHDLPTLIEIALQVGPMIAAFFLVLLAPVKERIVDSLAGRTRPARRVAAMVAVSAAAAVVIACASGAAVLSVCEWRPGTFHALTALWVAGELAFDLTLIGVFTTALYALTRRLWATILIFIAYIALAVTAGPAWGITSYIGFGSTVPVMITTYATAPLYDGAAWLLRGYWTCISLLIVSLLCAFDRPTRGSRPGKAWRPWAAMLAVCIAACAGLLKLQATGAARYQAPSSTVIAGALQGNRDAARVHLAHYDVRLDYLPHSQRVAVDGELAFRNGEQAARTAYFQLPELIHPVQFQIQGGGAYHLEPLGKYVQVRFDAALLPQQEVRVLYRGEVRRAGEFDLAVQSKVLDDAFFLTDTDLLPAARSAACIAASGDGCGSAENYLMSDRATGRVTVTAPEAYLVSGAGEEASRPLGGGRSEHVFTAATPRLATFLAACARFRESAAVSASGVRIRVLRSAAAAADGEVEAPLAESILSFYETVWPAYPRRILTIVETPTPLGEAMAFDGQVAISDKIIASRIPMAGAASHLLEFVMAHEIAHQWWGFNVAPARVPGRLFVLESIPQFAAYKFLGSRGVMNEETARQNEERRYRAAQSRLSNREVPLVRAETADEIAYNKGPFALLTLDQLGGEGMMNGLGSLIGQFSGGAHGPAAPEQVAAALVAQLPAGSRDTAHRLLYGAGDAARP